MRFEVGSGSTWCRDILGQGGLYTKLRDFISPRRGHTCFSFVTTNVVVARLICFAGTLLLPRYMIFPPCRERIYIVPKLVPSCALNPFVYGRTGHIRGMERLIAARCYSYGLYVITITGRRSQRGIYYVWCHLSSRGSYCFKTFQTSSLLCRGRALSVLVRVDALDAMSTP